MALTVTIKKLTKKSTCTIEGAGKLTAQEYFLIIASEPTHAAKAQELSSGTSPYPAIGDVFMDGTGDEIAGLFCVKLSTEAYEGDESRTLWLTTADYDSALEILPTNPTSIAAAFDYDSESYEETYFKDETPTTPKYAKNTAGTPFPELPKRDAAIVSFSVEKNVADTTTYASCYALINKVNSASVTLDGMTYAAGKLRCTGASLSKVKIENGFSFKTRVLKFKAHPNGWDQEYESLGFEAITSGVNWPIIDASTGDVISEPWPLDASGAALSSRSSPGATITLKPYKQDAMSSGIT